MDRRVFIWATAASLLAAPLAAEGQRAGRIARVGLLVPTAPIPATARLGITQDLLCEANLASWLAEMEV